jgi:hypothetical protein
MGRPSRPGAHLPYAAGTQLTDNAMTGDLGDGHRMSAAGKSLRYPLACTRARDGCVRIWSATSRMPGHWRRLNWLGQQSISPSFARMSAISFLDGVREVVGYSPACALPNPTATPFAAPTTGTGCAPC